MSLELSALDVEFFVLPMFTRSEVGSMLFLLQNLLERGKKNKASERILINKTSGDNSVCRENETHYLKRKILGEYLNVKRGVVEGLGEGNLWKGILFTVGIKIVEISL